MPLLDAGQGRGVCPSPVCSLRTHRALVPVPDCQSFVATGLKHCHLVACPAGKSVSAALDHAAVVTRRRQVTVHIECCGCFAEVLFEEVWAVQRNVGGPSRRCEAYVEVSCNQRIVRLEADRDALAVQSPVLSLLGGAQTERLTDGKRLAVFAVSM